MAGNPWAGEITRGPAARVLAPECEVVAETSAQTVSDWIRQLERMRGLLGDRPVVWYISRGGSAVAAAGVGLAAAELDDGTAVLMVEVEP